MFQSFLWTLALVLLTSCVSVPLDFSSQKLSFQTLLPKNHPLLRHSVLLLAEKNGQLAFCNGVFLGTGTVLTSGHCVFEEFSYFVFVPVKVSSKDPFTEIDMVAVKSTAQQRHEKFSTNSTSAFVENDLGVVRFNSPKDSLLQAVQIVTAAKQFKQPSSIKWSAGEESFFKVEPANTLNISGFRMDKSGILKGILQTNDVASFVGRIPSSQSLLVSLNPGTSIHSGVSGSGVFLNENGKYALAGIVSHYVPGINLLGAADVQTADEMIRNWQKAEKK